MVTYTTTYNLKKPTVGQDDDQWGAYANDTYDLIDDLLDGTTPVTGIDINSGTLDNAVIGGTTAAAGTFTTLSATTSLGVTGNITVSGTVDGVDIATRDAVLTSTTTTANAALPKAGGTLTGALNFGDNVKAQFGTGSDLEIYHDGSNSYIFDGGTGNLALTSDGAKVSLAKHAPFEFMVEAITDGAVNLYYDGSKKLATTSTGIDVTGNVTVSGTVDGRDVASDGSKLDGIESGATADQTKADIDALGIAASTAATLATARNIALSGDVSGSASFDGSANISITTTVADDSHNHVISNVDGLQTALDAKSPLANPDFTGVASFGNMITVGNSGTRLSGGNDLLEIYGGTASFHMGVQDGSGRVQMRWNASTGTAPTYQVSSEPSARFEIVDVTSPTDSLWKIDYAAAGTAGDTISYSNIMSLGTSTFTYNGNSVWHQGNDGSGSGLDADTVDGIQATSFLRSDANDSMSGNLTINASGGTGLVVEGVADQFAALFSKGLDSPDEPATVLIVSDADTPDDDLAFEIRGNTTGASVDKTTTMSSTDTTFAVFGGGTTVIGYNSLGTSYTVPNSAKLAVNGAIDASSLYINDNIYHDGDTDTYLGFGTNTINLVTGNSTSATFNSSGIFVTDGSVAEDYDALSGTTPTCNVDNGGAFSLTMTGNTTFTFSGASSGYSQGFVLQLTGNGSTVTWPTSVDWAGGTAPDAPASGETDIYVFWTRDGGTTWYGVQSIDAAA